MMAATAVVATLLWLVRPVYFYLDATVNGPVTRAYNRDREVLAAANNLVGKPQAEAVRVLGEPVEVWEYTLPQKGRTTTLAYSPSWLGGLGTFQVHCRGGIVVGVARQPD